MITALILGCVSALALLLTLSRALGFNRILKYNIAVDIGTTTLLMIIFHGTLGGMLTAIFGGLVIAVFLTIAKKCSQIELSRYV